MNLPFLRISPNKEISFQGPFNRKSQAKITLSNPSFNHALAFKIKSTAMKGLLVVKPATGILRPLQVTEVHLTLMPVNTGTSIRPPPHRLLVQAVRAEVHAHYGPHVWVSGQSPSAHHLQCVYAESKSKTLAWADGVPHPSTSEAKPVAGWNQHVEMEICAHDANLAFLAEDTASFPLEQPGDLRHGWMEEGGVLKNQLAHITEVPVAPNPNDNAWTADENQAAEPTWGQGETHGDWDAPPTADPSSSWGNAVGASDVAPLNDWGTPPHGDLDREKTDWDGLSQPSTRHGQCSDSSVPQVPNLIFPVNVIRDSLSLLFTVLCVGIILGKCIL